MPRFPFPRRWVLTVDGPAGAGKSTAAQGLAKALGYRHVDTGAMYRAAAWATLRAGVDASSSRALSGLLARTTFDFSKGGVRVNGVDVAAHIRTPEVTGAASAIAARPAVRRLLVRRQRQMGRGGGVVMEGRDIGTVVFPRADLKFFLDASPEERANRRWREIRKKGERADRAAIARAIRERDRRDRGRTMSPLRAAADAIVLDTTGCSVAETRRRMLRSLRQTADRARARARRPGAGPAE